MDGRKAGYVSTAVAYQAMPIYPLLCRTEHMKLTLQDKLRKVSDIWQKANTFPPAAMERIQSKLTATPPAPVPDLETEGDDLDDGPSYASVPAAPAPLTLDDSKGNSHFLIIGHLKADAAACTLALEIRLDLYGYEGISVGYDPQATVKTEVDAHTNAAATYSIGSLPRCDRATCITLFAPYRPNVH
jgi:hypothetical protein